MHLTSPNAGAGFFHQKGLYDDPKGGLLREALSRRLRLHVHIINKLLLFADIKDEKHYEITIYRGSTGPVSYDNMSNVLHPSTLDGSFEHDGVGPVPGIKNEDGDWDLRPHRSRLVHVDETALALFASLYDPPGTPAVEARLPVVHSQEVLSALKRFASAPRKLADLGDGLFHTEHFHETNQQKDGTIRRETRAPKTAKEWIVSGPHFFVGTPFNKTPNAGCKHNQDYSAIDLTQIPEDYLPRTNYVPACTPAEYQNRTPTWDGRPVTDFYRHVHRRMVAPTGERTLVPSIIPPGAAHINTLVGIAVASEKDLMLISGMAASIPADFFFKSSGKSDIYPEAFSSLPLPSDENACTWTIHRALALNCLTNHYADLWDRNLPKKKDLLPSAKSTDPRCADWEKAPRTWTWHAPLRTHYARRQALVELDALAALSLHMTLDELQLIYRVQFPVLQQYERETYYDRRGKIVFTISKGLSGVGLDRKQWESIKAAKAGEPLPEWAVDAGGAFEPPFDRCDREEDMAQAYAYFKERLGDA